MPHDKNKPIKLTKEEIESNWLECGMPDFLKRCKGKRKSRRIQNPPFTSVRYTRDYEIRYTTETNEFIALIFWWSPPNEERQVFIREFVCPEDGKTYRLKLGNLGSGGNLVP